MEDGKRMMNEFGREFQKSSSIYCGSKKESPEWQRVRIFLLSAIQTLSLNRFFN
jgi:hypothetical protein